MNYILLAMVILTLYLFLPGVTILNAEVTAKGFPDYDLQMPTGDKKAPCLIICPGRGYHKELPLIKNLARAATSEGFVTVRFDWTFFTEREKPSADGSAELEDVLAILELVKAQSRVDTTRIYLAGKSLGSLLAYAAFQEQKSIKGCLLLTPVLPSAAAGEDYYPNLQYETRQVAFILGENDRDNCPLTELYKFLGTCAKAFPVVVLAGAHSFELGYDDKNPLQKQVNDYNTKTAVESTMFWLRTFEYPHLNK